MKKTAFTIIEILISIILLSLLVIFSISILSQTKVNIKNFKSYVSKSNYSIRFRDVLFKDIVLSSHIYLKSDKKYSLLYLKTKNSIYNIDEPYIVWYISKKDKALMRLESARYVKLPILEEQKKIVFADLIEKWCQNFIIQRSKDKKYLYIFLKFKNQNPLFFEVSTIQYLNSSKKDSNQTYKKTK